MLTTNMTNRQKADFYNDLNERAEKLFSLYIDRLTEFMTKNTNYIADCIVEVVNATKKDEDFETYTTENLLWWDSDFEIMKSVSTIRTKKLQALELAVHFRAKYKVFEQKAKEDFMATL